MISETFIAPINLCLVDSWLGERDLKIGLPWSCSFGITLSADEMNSKTTVAASETFKENKFWIACELMPFEDNKYLMHCIESIQQLALKHGNLRFPISWKLHIHNTNTFPIDADFNGDEPGFASLVLALARLYGLPKWEDISTITRSVCGASCRCLYGGFVHWYKGYRDDGLDSIAIPAVPSKHWPSIHAVILVMNASDPTYLTEQLSLKHVSELLENRFNVVVPDTIKQLIQTIKARQFEDFAKIVTYEANCRYILQKNANRRYSNYHNISVEVTNFIEAYNEAMGEIRVALTSHSGPHICLFVQEEHVAHLIVSLKLSMNTSSFVGTFGRGIPVNGLETNIKPFCQFVPLPANTLKFMIHTKIGEGPKQVLDMAESLINAQGNPQLP